MICEIKNVVAAYVLESLYIDGLAVAMVNGDIATSQAYIGWINYLFQTQYPQNDERQFSLIVEMLRSYYEKDGMSLEVSKKYGDKNLEAICFFSALTDASAYVIQAVSEVYGTDFWELWERVKDVAKRKRILYQPEIPQETISVSTMDFFGVTSDDMILFWDDNENVSFSQE